MPRLIGQDVSVLTVQNMSIAGASIGAATSLLADYESIQVDFERGSADVTATKDQADSDRATHFTGTITLGAMVRAPSNALTTFGTSAYGVVNFTTVAAGDAISIPVFIRKVGMTIGGKNANKETLELKMNGVPTLNGSPFVL